MAALRARWRRACGLVLLLGSVPGSASASVTAVESVPAVQQETARVWVNSTSRVYHCRGTRFYGTTKRGAYMSELEARAQGNRPAYGRACGPLPASEGPATVSLRSVSPDSASPKVWVNTSSGVYHCEGSRYYEATKRGRAMSERSARAAGYRPAYGKACS